MTKQVQRRRGTDTQHTSFTGAEGEISVNTTNKSIHVHDGATAGGIEAARADLGNVSDADLNSALTGNTLSSLTVTSADINGGTIDGTVIGGSTPAAGSFTTGSFTGNVSFGDNDKAIFGAGSDLQIYHSGTHSFIDDAGQGNLYVRANNLSLGKYTGESYITTEADGKVELYYDNSPKLETTSTGIDVTGTVTADGLTVNSGTTDTAALFQSSDSQSYIAWEDNTTATPIRVGVFGDNFIIGTSSAERMRIDSSGSVGIGTTTTSRKLNIQGDQGVRLFNDATNSYLDIDHGTDGAEIKQAVSTKDILLQAGTASGRLMFETGGSEAMRIDSSGNLLVGKTATDIGIVGHQFLADGGGDYAAHTSDGTRALLLNRKTSDGDIIDFRKDGAPVGSIGTVDGDLLVHSSASGHKGLRFGNGYVAPTDNSGVIQNATTDLGLATHRFKDLYLSGGVYLGGTGSANKLDDYETGYFSPTIARSTSNPTVTYTTASTFNTFGTGIRGRYVVIGTKVFCEVDIRFSAITGGSGSYRIGNLPFAATNGYSAGVVSEHTSGLTYSSYSTLNFEVQSSGSFANLIISGSGVTSTGLSSISDHNGYIIGSFSYTIA